MSRVQTVLFDMDEVLDDSEPYWQQIWLETVFVYAEDRDPDMNEVTSRNYRESLRDLVETYHLNGFRTAIFPFRVSTVLAVAVDRSPRLGEALAS
jgi:beta-phosphoglucomutase-like phosphatase (HAD superfamily)